MKAEFWVFLLQLAIVITLFSPPVVVLGCSPAGQLSQFTTVNSSVIFDSPPNCGRTMYSKYDVIAQPATGIIGGVTVTKRHQYPWLVRLVIASTTGTIIQFCGGSIISANYILTAGHCLESLNISTRLTIYFGDHDPTVLDPGEFTLTASSWTKHPWHNSLTNDYDFALLKLSESINFTSWAVQKICLPTNCDTECTLAGSGVYIAGWGTTFYGMWSTSTILQAAYILIGDWKTCQGQYNYLTDRMICAGYLTGGVDSCQGDSGGPLMSVNENGFYKLCGVTSFGKECAMVGYYGVYARVCSVLDWIKSNSDA